MAYIYVKATDPALIPGAVVETRSGFVRHRGIRGRRDPFTGEQPILHAPKNGVVGPTSDWQFSQGRPIRAVLVHPTAEAREITIQRMESLADLPWTLASSNCQHTTNWAALGIARSEQFDAALGLGILGAVLYALSKN